MKNKVKRLVVTLSGITIVGFLYKDAIGENEYSEEDYATLENTFDPYGRSKIA